MGILFMDVLLIFGCTYDLRPNGRLDHGIMLLLNNKIKKPNNS